MEEGINFTPEQMNEYKEYMEERAEEERELGQEMSEDGIVNNQEFMDAYGAPEPQELKNKDTFLHKSAFGSEDTLRTSFLEEWELGKPMFSVRFLLDLHKLSKYHLDPIVDELNKEKKKEDKNFVYNDISDYIWQKIQNITMSGMSNKGFLSNLTSSKKIEINRKKVNPDVINNLKGGKRR